MRDNKIYARGVSKIAATIPVQRKCEILNEMDSIKAKHGKQNVK